MKLLTTSEWIERAKDIHGDKYDYSKVNYVNSRIKIIIICPEHGEFEQTPHNHLIGNNCPKCSKYSNKYTTETWIEKAKKIHNDRYEYSKSIYTGANNKICITCKKHGDFWQRPIDHLTNCGCPKCSLSKGELLIYDWLTNNNIKFKHQYELITPKIARDSNLIVVDFFVIHNNKQYFIEYDGIQHFQYTPIFHKGGIIDFEKELRRDKVLNEFCELYKDKVTLIRFSYTLTDKEIIEELKNIYVEF